MYRIMSSLMNFENLFKYDEDGNISIALYDDLIVFLQYFYCLLLRGSP